VSTEISNSLEVLKNGGLLLYPTDTVWGIGCDASNEAAVKKIYELKQRDDSKALVCLVSDLEMLYRHIKFVPDAVLNILNAAKNPTTVIYNEPSGVAKNLVAQNNSLAIRIVKNNFCENLITKFGKPIVSTSANISGENTPKSFAEIGQSILKGVDYIVNLQKEKIADKPSSIIKLDDDGNLFIIRK